MLHHEDHHFSSSGCCCEPAREQPSQQVWLASEYQSAWNLSTYVQITVLAASATPDPGTEHTHTHKVLVTREIDFFGWIFTRHGHKKDKLGSCDVKVTVSNFVIELDQTSIVSGMWSRVDPRTYIKKRCG